MKKFEFTRPEFLFCEIPIKDNSLHDHRTWIYHLKSSSLIEFIEISNLHDFKFNAYCDYFEYNNETFFGVFTQNNCQIVGANESVVLKNAWLFYKNYLQWEDNN